MPSITLPAEAPRQTCFIDMPFGKKDDLKAGVRIDFDQVYEQGIKPAVEAAGLQCVRGDREDTGGIIHTAMFARLLMSEFVIADMTSANPNVFYELGVRHTARPYTTIALFATLSANVFINGVAFLIPTLHTRMGLDLAKAGLVSAMPSFGMVLTLIAWGYLVDRVGERLVLTVGSALTAVAAFAAAWAHSLVGLAAFQVLLSRLSCQQDIVVGSPMANRASGSRCAVRTVARNSN